MFKIFRFNCCGLDVHKTWIYACIGITDANGRTEYKQARFSSFPKGLRELSSWLAKYNCTEVCMESSGKYWIPVFNVLEQSCFVTLAHPKYTKPQKGNMSITKYILDHPGESFDVAQFVDRRCKTPIDVIQDAVDGAICPEQAVKLRECLAHIEQLEAHKAAIEQEILEIVKPFDVALDLLRTIPGLDSNPMTAIAILSEIGGDMSVFPTAKNLVSWAGCCPRNDQSAGKVKSTRISRAGCYLKPLLVLISNALLRSKKHPEFRERYRRIRARRGHKKAIIAVCRMLLTAIWNVLSKLEPYTLEGFLQQRPVPEDKVITKSQALNLLRLRGYVIKDEPEPQVG